MPEDVKLWTPESPSLYNMEVTLYKDGKAVDQVKSYTALRKFSTHKDKNGITRLQLNNKDYFQFGPLDQVGGRTAYTQRQQTKHWYMT